VTLTAVVAWNAVRELYLVSKTDYSLLQILGLQMNVERWEQANPPWDLSTSIGDFSMDLTVNQEWIKNSGVTDSTTVYAFMTALPPLSQPPDASNEESEIKASDEALPLLQWIMPKVKLSDEVDHTLYKGVWVATPATCQAWEIYMMVSTPAIPGQPSLIF